MCHERYCDNRTPLLVALRRKSRRVDQHLRIACESYAHRCVENADTDARHTDFCVVSRRKIGDGQCKNPIWLLDSVVRSFPNRFGLAR